MKYIYHFTSRKNWAEIKRLGKLVPHTDIEWVHQPDRFPERAKSICSEKRYIVGFPKPLHKGWVECGLWDEIFRLIKAEVLLKVKIPNNSKGFVREHELCSPKGMREKFGADVYFKAFSGEISVYDSKIQDSLVEYMNSSTPLSKYKGNFIVPEIWVPEEVPLSDIEEISFQR